MVRKGSIRVGDAVYAKWPGSAKYYEAIVEEVLDFEIRVSFKEASATVMDIDKSDVYRKSYFDNRSRSSSPARRRRSQSPSRRRSRSRSPSRRTSTPKRSTSESPPRQKRSSVRPRQIKPEKIEPKEEKTVEQTPEKHVEKRQTRSSRVEQASSSTHLTRSMTKSMVKEEKEALFDAKALDEMKEKSRRGRKPEYEFGGPLGAFFFMLALPALVYSFYFFCTGKESACTFYTNWKNVELPKSLEVYFNKGSLIVLAWIIFQAILYALPVGKVVQGVTLPDGTKLSYRTNGFIALIFTLAVFLLAKSKAVPLTYVYEKYPALMTEAFIISIVIAVFVFIKAKVEGTGLSTTGNTGNFLYDFFVGRQLNPRIGSFDLKFFFEMRPGLIGWIMINFCMASQEYKEFGTVSPAMIMVCFFQFVYVMDALIFESAILTTIDIVHEGFGFMLSFGNLVFVPFLFSVQARFLADHRVNIPWPGIIAIVVLKVIGFIIFRGSNLQKDCFKLTPNDPDFQDQETILTPSGKRLMVFGWWKMVRHPNYLGDLLMAVSWSLTCGFSHLIPWFYPIYLGCLLLHRQRRVEALCLKKYGKSYEEYCRRVPYRIIPLVY